MSGALKFLIGLGVVVTLLVVAAVVNNAKFKKPAWCSAAPACHQPSYDLGYHDGQNGVADLVSAGSPPSIACNITLSAHHKFENNAYLGPGFSPDDKSYLEGCFAALGYRD